MRLEQADYTTVRDEMMPGDLIAFAGKGRFSNIIKWRTRSQVSHVGAIFKRIVPGVSRVEVIESTSLYDKVGVQTNALSIHIEHYDGAIWWLPLNVTSSFGRSAYERFMLTHMGKPYDFKQAFFSAIDWLGPIVTNEPDYTAFFCSELIAGAWIEARLLPHDTNASELTPADLVRMTHYRRCVQLTGEPQVPWE